MRGIVDISKVFKVSGLLCPPLSSSVLEGTWAPGNPGAPTENNSFPMVFACRPAKSTGGHVRPPGARRGHLGPSMLGPLVFPRILKGFGLLCPPLSSSVLAPRRRIAEKQGISTVFERPRRGPVWRQRTREFGMCGMSYLMYSHLICGYI